MSQLTERARDWFELVWNQRDDDAIFELSAKNAVGYAESDIRYFSMETFKEFRDNVLAAMPDLHIDIEDVIEQSPDVVVRWFLTGTHTGNGFGFPPTRSRVTLRGMTWLRADDDNKFVEGWDCWNQGRMMQIFVGAAKGSPPPAEDDPQPTSRPRTYWRNRLDQRLSVARFPASILVHAPKSSSTNSPSETQASSSLSARKTLALAIASSLLLAAAFPPLNLFPLAWIAPIGWLLLIRTPVLPKGSYWILYLSGLLFWLTVLYGVGNAHWATRLFGWPVLCGYLACYTPLFVSISRLIVDRTRVPLPIVAPIVWTALEYFRAYFVTGFSLAMLGHTQVHLLPVVQIAEFVGAYGVSFAMMVVAALLASAIPTIWNEPTHPPDPKVLRRIVLAVAAFVIAIGYYGFGYFLFDVNGMHEWGYRGDHQDENARSVRIGLVQGSIDTVFGDPTQSSRTFEQYTALTDHLAKAHPDLDLIVWPETTMGDHMVFELGADYAPPADLPFDVAEHKKRITDRANGFNGFLKDLAVNRWQAPLLLGTSVLRYGNQRLDHYNSAIHVGREGTIINRYDKVHPVMFGEYVPFGEYAPFVYDWLPIGGGLTPGEGPVAIDVEGVSLVPCICFENTVPQLVAGQVRQLHEQGHDVDALVTLTNDGWFWGSSILDLHLTCARFRAIENRRPMLVAANTGISAVIDPSGHLSQYTPVRKTTYLVAEIFPTNRPLTHYTRHGDWFAFGCLVLTIVGGVAGLVIRRWKAQAPLAGDTAQSMEGF